MMEQSSKKNIFSIIFVGVVIVLIIGMILTSFLLSSKENEQWEYVPQNNSTDYFSDPSEDSFTYVSDFSASMQQYISSGIMQYLGLSENVSKLVNRIVMAAQEAGIPSTRLKTISEVINNNRLPHLVQNVTIPFETVDEFSIWVDNIVLSLTDENLFSIVGSFIHSFLEVTTLTEEELSRFIYEYLRLYASNDYKLLLNLYGKDKFVSFFSDTFFAIRVLSETNDDVGISFGTSALRSALYQLGMVYIDIVSIGGYNSFEKLLGFPDALPSTSEELDEAIQESYNLIKGSLGQIVEFFGNVMINVNKEDLQYYLELQRYNNDTYREIAILTDKKESGMISEENETRLAYLLQEKTRYSYLVGQNFSKLFITCLKKDGEKEYQEVLNNFRDVTETMRILMLFISDLSASNVGEYLLMIDDYSEKFSAAISYFSEQNKSYEEIMTMEISDEITQITDGFSCGNKLLELYVSSAFNIWFYYKVNNWGILQ